MHKYKVSIYWGVIFPNPFVSPKIYEVETATDLPNNEIIKRVLSELKVYPRSYCAKVEEITNELQL